MLPRLIEGLLQPRSSPTAITYDVLAPNRRLLADEQPARAGIVSPIPDRCRSGLRVRSGRRTDLEPPPGTGRAPSADQVDAMVDLLVTDCEPQQRAFRHPRTRVRGARFRLHAQPRCGGRCPLLHRDAGRRAGLRRRGHGHARGHGRAGPRCAADPAGRAPGRRPTGPRPPGPRPRRSHDRAEDPSWIPGHTSRFRSARFAPFTAPGGHRLAIYERVRPDAETFFSGRRDF